MIVSAIDSRMQSLIDYLNKHYPTEHDVRIVVLPGYDCIDTGDAKAWAVYDPAIRVLWVPGDAPFIDGVAPGEARQMMLEHVVHEYIHHIQACERRPFDEDEAEERAQEIVKSWMREVAG